MGVGAVAKSAGVTASPSAEYLDVLAHNVLQFVPGGFTVPPSIVQGSLGNTIGGRAADLSKPQRLSVFLGPQATLRGVVADLALRTHVTGQPPADPADLSRITQGVYVYNRAYLEGPPAPGWQVGLWLPLPIEIDGVGTWTTDWATIMGLSATFNPARWPALDTPAAALPIPDPDALTSEVTAFLTGKDLAATAGVLVSQFVTNPFECVFRIFEVFRQLPTTGVRSQSAVAIAMVTGLNDREITLLGQVTAGNGVLRRLWSAISGSAASGAPAVRDRLAGALGLAGGAGAWQNPDVVGPSVVPLEVPLRPPLPAGVSAPAVTAAAQAVAASTMTTEDPGGNQGIALGRVLCVGNPATHPQKNRSTWTGPAYTGRMPPAPWVRAHLATLRLNTQQELARLDVVLKIAPNEGFLDGSRAADKGTLSSGIHQWSIHLNDELPALLERFRMAAPDHYDLFFGMYGLQVMRWARATPGLGGLEAPITPPPAAPSPPEANIRRDNPDAYNGTTPITDPKDYNVGYATCGSLAPGGSWTLLPQPPDNVRALGPRHLFFKAAPRTPGPGFIISPEWCARARLASLCSSDYRHCQIWAAVYRFERLRVQVGAIPVDGASYTAPELLNSEFVCALALDQHINSPWEVPVALRAAAARTLAAVGRPAGPDDMRAHDTITAALPHPPLSAAWLLALGIDYLQVRQLEGKDHRDAAILKLHNAGLALTPPTGLSARPGSFRGW